MASTWNSMAWRIRKEKTWSMSTFATIPQPQHIYGFHTTCQFDPHTIKYTQTHIYTLTHRPPPPSTHRQHIVTMLGLLPFSRTFHSLYCEHLHRVIKQSRRLNTVNVHLHTGGGTKQINDFLIAVHRSFHLQSSTSNINNKSTAQRVFETILGDSKTDSDGEEEDASYAFFFISLSKF